MFKFFLVEQFYFAENIYKKEKKEKREKYIFTLIISCQQKENHFISYKIKYFMYSVSKMFPKIVLFEKSCTENHVAFKNNLGVSGSIPRNNLVEIK